MAKDRNTMAKRQREVEKRQKQMDKRDNRERKKTETPTATDEAVSRPQRLSDGEVHVLSMFRKYLMTPGKMLCISSQDITSMKKSLDKLTLAGLLVPEEFKGGYSLTRSGYEAMQEIP